MFFGGPAFSRSALSAFSLAIFWVIASAPGSLPAEDPRPDLDYVWLSAGRYSPEETIAARFPAPAGAARISVRPGSFSDWLRNLPVQPGRPPVLLHTGAPRADQSAHAAVIRIDVGRRDLQQCADALMRLRAEYLFSRRAYDRIRFQFTDGVPAQYSRWRAGERPLVRNGQKTRWRPKAKASGSYASFRAYLHQVFTYAGTYSLSRESKRRAWSEVQIGDFLLQGGFPGHGVIIVDLARSNRDPNIVYALLAQSYMPAQSVHILRNPTARASTGPSDVRAGAWYRWDLRELGKLQRVRGGAARSAEATILTSDWKFYAGDLMRFAH